jgi:hypothetical protein
MIDAILDFFKIMGLGLAVVFILGVVLIVGCLAIIHFGYETFPIIFACGVLVFSFVVGKILLDRIRKKQKI